MEIKRNNIINLFMYLSIIILFIVLIPHVDACVATCCSGTRSATASLSMSASNNIACGNSATVNIGVSYSCPNCINGVTGSIELYRNGNRVKSWSLTDPMMGSSTSYSTTVSYNSGSLESNANWHATVHFYKGCHCGDASASASTTTNVGTCNTPPTQPSVEVSPKPATVNQNLLCEITEESTDIDGDDITYRYQWFRGNELMITRNHKSDLSDTLQSTQTDSNQVWTCRVTPYDGKDHGNFDQDSTTILPLINGECNSLIHGSYFYNAPIYDLCSEGYPGSVNWNSVNNRWQWTCYGSNEGVNDDCYAFETIDARCGNIDGSGENPNENLDNLCDVGISSVITDSWTWECMSPNNGLNANCASNKQIVGDVNIFCETNPPNVNSIIGYILEGEEKNDCDEAGWFGDYQKFICHLPESGETYELCCGINEGISERASPDMCTDVLVCDCLEEGVWNTAGDKKCDGCWWQVMPEVCDHPGDEKYNINHDLYGQNCDYDSQTCDKGYDDCKVDMVSISEITNACPGEVMLVYCEVSVGNINSLYLNISKGSTSYIYDNFNWNGRQARFQLIAPPDVGHYDFICSINQSRSFSNTPFMPRNVFIRGEDCCSGYTTESVCKAGDCDWCLSCRSQDMPDVLGSIYTLDGSDDAARCVRSGSCIGKCVKGRCGAICNEDDIHCNTTTCQCNYNAGYDYIDGVCKPTAVRTTGFTEKVGGHFYNSASYNVEIPTKINFKDSKEFGINDDIIIYYRGIKKIQDAYLRNDANCEDDTNRNDNFECFFPEESDRIICNIHILENFIFSKINYTFYGCVKMGGKWYVSPKEKFTLNPPEPCPEGTRLCEDLVCRPDCTNPGNESYCGNNRLDPGEQCDGVLFSPEFFIGDFEEGDFEPVTCELFGYNAGTVSCNTNCTLDTSRCYNTTPQRPTYQPTNEIICGNGIIQPGQTCECDDGEQYCSGGNYIGPTCEDLGFDSGEVSCQNCQINTSLCEIELQDPFCGDGNINPGEQCDGYNLGKSTCEKLGFDGGYLSCNFDCTFNVNNCYIDEVDDDGSCGDGIINLHLGEQCDGDNLGGISCQDLGFASGILSCFNCRLDTSGCEGEIVPDFPKHDLDYDDDGVDDRIDPDITGIGIPNALNPNIIHRNNPLLINPWLPRFSPGLNLPEGDLRDNINDHFTRFPSGIGTIDDLDGDGIPNIIDPNPYEMDPEIVEIIRDKWGIPENVIPRINFPATELECNFNGICEPWESCLCPDCEGKQNGCEDGLRCHRGVCSSEYCGDGIIHEHLGQECDDGLGMTTTGDCVHCRHAYCGDGYVHFGFEDCDYGPLNGLPGIPCSADCQFKNEDIPGIHLLRSQLVKNYSMYGATDSDYQQKVKYYLLDSRLTRNNQDILNPLIADNASLLNDYLSPDDCLVSIKHGESCIQIWYINVTNVNDREIYRFPEDIAAEIITEGKPVNPLPFFARYEMNDPTKEDDENRPVDTPTFRIRLTPKQRNVPFGIGVLRSPSNDDMTWEYDDTIPPGLQNRIELPPGLRGKWRCQDGFLRVGDSFKCEPIPPAEYTYDIYTAITTRANEPLGDGILRTVADYENTTWEYVDSLPENAIERASSPRNQWTCAEGFVRAGQSHICIPQPPGVGPGGPAN